MKILIFDTECNSLDVNEGYIQELAWAMYDSETKRLFKCNSQVVKWRRPYKVEPSAYEVTKLDRDFCEEFGQVPFHIREFLFDLNDADIICGHNITSYDIPMLYSNMRKIIGLAPERLELDGKIIIDTYLDLPIKKTNQNMTLKYLALDHGYVLNEAHQAIADVFACAHILFSYNLDEVIKIAKSPMITISVTPDWNDSVLREKLSQLRFRWNRDAKVWEKRTKEFFKEDIKAKLETAIMINGQPEAAQLTMDVELPF